MTMDELSARELLDRLANTEPPPARVDVGLARRRGRRMLFWRHAGAPGGSALAVIAVAALISSNVITLGSGPHGPAPGPVHPQKVLSAFAPYATFGWVPAGFTLKAGSAVRWWVSSANFTQGPYFFPGGLPTDTASPQHMHVNIFSAAGLGISLTVNAENDCTFGSSATMLPGRVRKHAKKGWPAQPYELMCKDGTGSNGNSVGPLSGEVNGSPAYGGGGLAWQYAKGSWAELQPEVSDALPVKQQQSLMKTWMGSHSAATNAMLLRIADNIRFGERAESFAFRLNGAPKIWHQYNTTYAYYGGRMINTSLWLGPDMTANSNAAEIAVTPASKSLSCGFVQGESRYVTLDGTRFTLSYMRTNGNLQPTNQQVLCGYVNGLQVNVAVSTQALHPVANYSLQTRGMSSFIGTDIHNAAVTLFRHMTLLGPDPANWTTHPLD
jgi:hypothetical protein